MYHDFLTEQKQQGVCVEEPQEELDVYDLAALAYLYRRMRETEVISEAHHIVVDEAQDFGVMVYAVLKECVRSCTYTVMGGCIPEYPHGLRYQRLGRGEKTSC